jgi:uncharacterized membrane protein YphA (DoxX/SURF4 family)
MLSLLPQILFLGAFAATLIRLSLACMLAYSAWTNVSKSTTTARVFAILETAVGAALFVGAWTQAFAILGVVLCAVSLVQPHVRVWPRSTVALMLVMMLTLVVTGPGAFAFDLPL